MIQRRDDSLSLLYEADETAWLEAMAERIAEGRFDELDFEHLGEYLSDMARRDRREVHSRLTVLIAHWLKWLHQPEKRTPSWQAMILHKRQELRDLVERGVLRNHAIDTLEKAYADAVELAAVETGMRAEAFPKACPHSLDEFLTLPLTD